MENIYLAPLAYCFFILLGSGLMVGVEFFKCGKILIWPPLAYCLFIVLLGSGLMVGVEFFKRGNDEIYTWLNSPLLCLFA